MWCSRLGRELSVWRPGGESFVTPIAYDEPMLIWWEGRATWRRVSSLKFRHFFFLFLNFYILESGKFLKRQLYLLCFSLGVFSCEPHLCSVQIVHIMLSSLIPLRQRDPDVCRIQPINGINDSLCGIDKTVRVALRDVHTHRILNTYSANYSPVIQ